MIQRDLVSVIIPVWNRGKYLIEAVQSVFAQSYRPMEILIIDDGSSDETATIADGFKKTFPNEVKVLHIENSGPGMAREAGRQLACGEFIQYLDSDDILLPEKFEIQVEALRKNPDCGIAYGYTRLIDDDGRILAAPYKWTGRTLPSLFPWLLVDRWWNTHTPLFRRSVCDAAGPWKNMRLSEDWEYEARVGALKTKLIHCPAYLSDTRHHQETRLTAGRMDSNKIRDTGQLIVTLYESSQTAEIATGTSEMQHFSRWAFLVARQAGESGLIEISEKCFQIAQMAAGPQRRQKMDFKMYSAMTKILGWKTAAKMSGLAIKVLKKNPGPETLRQSWMGRASEPLNENT